MSKKYKLFSDLIFFSLAKKGGYAELYPILFNDSIAFQGAVIYFNILPLTDI